MASENVQHFTDASFDTDVLKSDVPVLVDFWAEWCGPCQRLGPTIDQIAEEFKGKVRVGKVDTDANQKTAMRYGISGIPTVLVFKKGELVKTLRGEQPKRVYKEALETIVAAG